MSDAIQTDYLIVGAGAMGMAFADALLTDSQADIVIVDREAAPNTVHVDCSASAIQDLDTTPIFEGNRITLQTVRSYQPAFSAAMIGYIETTDRDLTEKNRLCTVVPLPNHDTDFPRFTSAFMLISSTGGKRGCPSLAETQSSGWLHSTSAVSKGRPGQNCGYRPDQERIVPGCGQTSTLHFAT